MTVAPVGLGTRSGADRCPGALELHEALDGPLARVRVPGGLLSATQLDCLVNLATRYAAGTLDLTARTNLQLRGVRDPDALALGLAQAGLLPSAAHDQARNYAISPLTGLGMAGAPDARPLLAALDAAVLSTPTLADLSGRFQFSIDDGSGLAPAGDVGLRWIAGCWRLMLDGHDAGPGDIDSVTEAAQAFLTLRGDDIAVWRVRDLPGGRHALATLLGRTLGDRPAVDGNRLAPGVLTGAVDVVVVAAPLQRLSATQATTLAGLIRDGGQLRLAPAGRCVIPAESTTSVLATLRHAGLIVDADDPRGNVTACSGLGACVRATVDIRAIASATSTTAALHVVACPRGCGRPEDATLEIRL